MDLGINGKVALVGASAGGLGLATAQRLASEGCNVAICDINADALPGAREAVMEAGGGKIRVFTYSVDLSDASAITEMVSAIQKDLGSIDILVTNAGGPPPGTFDDATDAKWLRAYELTFMSTVRLIRSVLPEMKTKGWGRIINLASRALLEPIPNLMISNATRLAVSGMAKTLAPEIASSGITINNIGPGPTSTDRAIELAGARAKKKGISVEEELELTAKQIPHGRLGKPEEVAATAAFFASELAGHITGTTLLVDGGETKAL